MRESRIFLFLGRVTLFGRVEGSGGRRPYAHSLSSCWALNGAVFRHVESVLGDGVVGEAVFTGLDAIAGTGQRAQDRITSKDRDSGASVLATRIALPASTLSASVPGRANT